MAWAAVIRKGLQKAIEAKALADILDPQVTVLIVRETETEPQCPIENSSQNGGYIISFAKWIHPMAEGEEYIETPWVWPEGTALDVLEAWTTKVEEAEKRVLGNKPCYRKFIYFNFFFLEWIRMVRACAT